MAGYILSLTLNPCLDKTLTVPEWKQGDNVRGSSVRAVVGGKGNNVARALKALGASVRPMTFLGGATGRYCENLLRLDDGLDPVLIHSQAETRTILTLRTGETSKQTAFFDPDPAISESEAIALLDLVNEHLESGNVRALTLSGSSPSLFTHTAYADCVRMARKFGVPVLLDTYGPALRHLGDAVPDVIQLNLKEAACYLGLNPTDVSQEQLVSWLSGWVSRGCLIAVVTRGPEAAIAVTQAGSFSMIPPEVNVVNPIGSGDCFMAGLTFGLLHNMQVYEHLRFASGCAVANAMVWDAGAITPELVRLWSGRVNVSPLGALPI